MSRFSDTGKSRPSAPSDLENSGKGLHLGKMVGLYNFFYNDYLSSEILAVRKVQLRKILLY